MPEFTDLQHFKPWLKASLEEERHVFNIIVCHYGYEYPELCFRAWQAYKKWLKKIAEIE